MYLIFSIMGVHSRGAVNVSIAMLKTVAYPFHVREKSNLPAAYFKRHQFINGKMFAIIIDTCEYDVDYMRKKFIKNLDYMYLLAEAGVPWGAAYEKMRQQEGLFDY